MLKPAVGSRSRDVVSIAPLPDALQAKVAALTGCVSGASPVADLNAALAEAGFTDVRVDVKPGSREFIRDWMPGRARRTTSPRPRSRRSSRRTWRAAGRPAARAEEAAAVIQANARGAWAELEGQLRPFVARRLDDAGEVDDVLQDTSEDSSRGRGPARLRAVRALGVPGGAQRARRSRTGARPASSPRRRRRRRTRRRPRPTRRKTPKRTHWPGTWPCSWPRCRRPIARPSRSPSSRA